MKKEKTTVGIQGLETSFHDIAARAYFKQPFTLVECTSFATMCEALHNGKCQYAVMAIENSIAGSILPNYFLLQDYHFTIVGEIYQPIHLHLLAQPGVKLKDIRHVQSHPMAIRQCTDFLRQLKNVSVLESEDTATAAKKIMNGQRDIAAIANEQSAEKFGLQILEKRIETHKKNFTRFLILQKKAPIIADANKASLYFQVMNKVGSLADILKIFKEHALNLSKIQSIPIVGKPSQYSIHVDVIWTKREQYDRAISLTLREVKSLSVLGEYKAATIEYQ